MSWVKKGLIYVSEGNFGWNVSHAQLPIVDINHSDIWRVYYSSRNASGQSNTSYLDVEPGNPSNILYVHDSPILPLGNLGTFDESGIMPVAIIDFNERKYLFYAGWSLRKTVPYHNTIGVAISDDQGKKFKKYGEGPIFDSLPFEPYSNGTACISIEDGLWKAWYQSVTKWMLINNRPEPFYHIKYAESTDGLVWSRNGQVAIDFANQNEAGICSASVIKENNIYQMWYCYRNLGDYRQDSRLSYRIGCAHSEDGINWERQDKYSGIDVSEHGWDSQMIAYPNVVNFRGTKYMFFNGNGFGRSGFGYAIQTN